MKVEISSHSETASRGRLGSHIAAGGVVFSHSLQHLYGQGFYVILPVIYRSLGLTPVTTGLVGTFRQISSGFASLVGGFWLDRHPKWRALSLCLSLSVMGLGYLLVGLAPNYSLILLSLALAGAAGSLWHPAAISLLSQRYPGRRGFMMALHRSTGNAGDALGPMIVGALLGVFLWKYILFGAFPVAVILITLLWILLRQTSFGEVEATKVKEDRGPGDQFGVLKELLKRRELILLLLVSGINGLGQGSLMLWLPMYLQETQGVSSLGIGTHLGLLSSVGIASGPFIGILSDRIGRKQVIFMVLLAKVTIAVLMALVQRGIGLTILVGFMGAFLFALNPLEQAAALDIAEGKKIEGTMVGLLWGNNAAFGGLSPVIAGALISSLGYGILFWYIAATSILAGIPAFALLLTPRTRTR